MELPQTYKAILSQGKGETAKLEEVALPNLGQNEVLVKVDFAPINPSDIGMIRGVYVNPAAVGSRSIGLEGSGTIAAVGEGLKVPHKVGDKVYIMGPGTMAQYLINPSEICLPIHEEISLEEAACHFVNPGTVYYMGVLAERGNHKAAIHTAGSSALGKMMIRYFKQKGIKSINIVRRDDYTEELKKEGADYVLNSQAPDFEEQLRTIAEKESATVAFDAISGDMTNRILKSMPTGSTCYVYGGMGGFQVTGLDIQELMKGKKVEGLQLNNFMQEQRVAGKLGELFTEVHKLLPTVFKSSIQKVYKLEELQEALAYYGENSSKGKILLKPN